jgi:hypothetical protein
MTPQAAGPAHQSWGASSGRYVAIGMIGLAVAARLARDTRTYEPAVTAVIVFAAVAGLARASRAQSFARLAAWDKRRSANQLRGRKARRA